MSIFNIQTTNVTVDLKAPSGNPAIVNYKVLVVGGSASQMCTVLPSASPLRCTISDLSAYTAYKLRAVGCLPGTAGCGYNREANVRTSVNGKFLKYLLALVFT